MTKQKLSSYSISDLQTLEDRCLYKMRLTRPLGGESSIPLDHKYWRYKKAMNIFSEEVNRRTELAIEEIEEEINQYELL